MAQAGAAIAQSPGAGSRLQLAARGPQDLFLLDERHTVFRHSWKRHPPFDTQLVSVSIDVTPGKRSVAELPHSGDALSEITLEMSLPAVPNAPPDATWVANLGYAMLRRVRFLIDDAEVHNYERLWYDIYDKLHTTGGHARGLAAMVGSHPLSTAVPHVLYVPLRFLTSRKGSPRPMLPLRALPRARLVVDIEFEDLAVLLPAGVVLDPTAIKATILCEMVEVDDAEKRGLMQPMTIAYETVIDTDALSYRFDSDGDAIDMDATTVDFSRVTKTVKTLAWVAYDERSPMLFDYVPRPLKTVELTFDGIPREREKLAGYFDLYQRYVSCRRCDDNTGRLGVYSYALDATSRHQTGAADYAAVARPGLRGTIAKRPTKPRFKLKVFAVCHNYLEIGGGSARTVFT